MDINYNIQELIFDYLDESAKIKLLHPTCNNIVHPSILIGIYNELVEIKNKSKKYYFTTLFYIKNEDSLNHNMPCNKCKVIGELYESLFQCVECDETLCYDCGNIECACDRCWNKNSDYQLCIKCCDKN
jgi:hypothetical protein